MKSFIITIDTEGDNQWDLLKESSTENSRYIPRFQELCEKYDFKPTWLTNYEMVKDPFYVEYMKDCLKNNLCEVGMHLHAWNNPPEYHLKKINNQRDYLIEYPYYIMEEKINVLTSLLEETFQRKMISHRSGRWTTDERYFKILKKYGYKVDCSVTPLVNWNSCLGSTGVMGSDYSKCSLNPYYIYEDILEVPMTIRKSHILAIDRIDSIKGILRESKNFIKGKNEWLRPQKKPSIMALKSVLRQVERDSDYAMFMIHSSELMPGGSHSFKDKKEIDYLYECIESLFDYAKKKEYIGVTLSEYRRRYDGEK